MKHVYGFAENVAETHDERKSILGGKGASLNEMTALGFPVPSGFTITTEVCQQFNRSHNYPEGLKQQVESALTRLESATGKRFGDAKNPLLVSVRSGAAISMPGMMDTVLNIGLNAKTLLGLTRADHERFGWDAYRRLVQMFGNVVGGIDHARFQDALEQLKSERGVSADADLNQGDLKELTLRFEALFVAELGQAFPQDPEQQLWAAIDAVFRSWHTPRAVTYRKINAISRDVLGTAVNVQAMVFGNQGETSASGVAFTRDPATGQRKERGEYLPNAQGEDVVAGLRTPEALDALQQTMPAVYAQLQDVLERLERHFRVVQDVEFTVEEGTLYLLQTRAAKLSATAAVRVAVDMAQEGLITQSEALLRVQPRQLAQLMHPSFDPQHPETVLAAGLGASPGAASGRVAFEAAQAERWAEQGKDVILVRQETSPDDIGGMQAAQGLLTSRGGFTSHAAIVARAMGKPCVSGCEALHVDAKAQQLSVGDVVVQAGEWLSIDGGTGEVFRGQRPLVPAQLDACAHTLLSWADGVRRLGVRANADTPHEARLAKALGAEGIGLARTEHMFFAQERMALFQQVIVTRETSQSASLLQRLGRFQQQDFEGLLEAMDGLPVVIRLLDPPLHEFLPKTASELERLAQTLHLSEATLGQRVAALQEFNPMLGHRGCRLGVTHPQIYEMQVEAIARATVRLQAAGKVPQPRIMIPLIGDGREMQFMRHLVSRALQRVLEDASTAIKIGTMIEVPRACVCAEAIATHAEFFSFGTNDLTQMTFGFSRDDAAKFLPAYKDNGLLPQDPFQQLDQEGVGQLMALAVERGRQGRAGLGLGLCGEHGGDAASVTFCHQVGLDYVSASPYRVPLARLTAAQAALSPSGESTP